jgi:hypothetical protein
LNKLAQEISTSAKDSFNFELICGLLEAYLLGAKHMDDITKKTPKYFFYTVTAAGMMHNGVLMTTSGYFNIRFLIDVALKGKPNVIIHWWTEISRDQSLEYIGPKEMLRLENEMIPHTKPTTTTSLRLVKNPKDTKSD